MLYDKSLIKCAYKLPKPKISIVSQADFKLI